jgi:DNA-binding response OmpR family regulator
MSAETALGTVPSKSIDCIPALVYKACVLLWFPTEKILMRPILIVLSAREARSRFAEILSQAGYEVAEADSGESALELAKSILPSLVLLAIVMPSQNGIQIAGRLRAIIGPQSTNIILLGSLPPIGLEDEPLASLVDGYLNIDVPADELLACVSKHVKRNHQAK